MAEVVASIIGISSFGIKLTDTLYQFGSTFSAARDQTIRISERITDYTTILDILTTTIEDEADFVSDQAVVMIRRLCDQSIDLFYDIEDQLPTRRDLHGHDSISFRDKLLWTFRKSRVELLLGQLEYVKSNVLLIVMTTLVGRKIRSRKKYKQKSKVKAEKLSEDLQRQELRARNAIVQHMNAGERLEELKTEAASADDTAFASAGTSGALVKSNMTTAIAMISHQAEAITRFQRAMLQVEDPTRRQAFVVEKSSLLLEDLLMQWTTSNVAKERAESPEAVDKATGSDKTAARRKNSLSPAMDRKIRASAEVAREKVEAAEIARARTRYHASKDSERVSKNESSTSDLSESESERPMEPQRYDDDVDAIDAECIEQFSDYDPFLHHDIDHWRPTANTAFRDQQFGQNRPRTGINNTEDTDDQSDSPVRDVSDGHMAGDWREEMPQEQWNSPSAVPENIYGGPPPIFVPLFDKSGAPTASTYPNGSNIHYYYAPQFGGQSSIESDSSVPKNDDYVTVKHRGKTYKIRASSFYTHQRPQRS